MGIQLRHRTPDEGLGHQQTPETLQPVALGRIGIQPDEQAHGFHRVAAAIADTPATSVASSRSAPEVCAAASPAIWNARTFFPVCARTRAVRVSALAATGLRDVDDLAACQSAHTCSLRLRKTWCRRVCRATVSEGAVLACNQMPSRGSMSRILPACISIRSPTGLTASSAAVRPSMARIGSRESLRCSATARSRSRSRSVNRRLP